MSVDDAIDDDPQVARLVSLAREKLSGEAPRREQQSFARLEARMRAAQAGPSPIFVRGGILAAAAAFAVFVGWYTLRPSDLTYKVDNGQLANDGFVLGGAGTRIVFSDGSQVSLEAGSRTRVAELDPSGGRLRLEGGAAHVSIAKKPGAAWSLEAGPYTVKVTGTAFDVRWAAAQRRFEIEMDHGSVIVTGPFTGTGVALRAGQRLVGRVDEGRVVVDQVGARASDAPEATQASNGLPAPAPKAVDEAVPSAGPSSMGAPRVETTRGPSWSQKVAQGEFATVLHEAEQRGLDRTLASSSLDDLSALADAARYARRRGVAERALLAERQRFPGSRPAREAAFFLGRLKEEAGGGGALEWYERYLNESPQGSYVSQALGRKMMLIYQQSGASAARSNADAYLARYPNGPYAAAARKIVNETRR